jgi:hypothetical protein
MLNRFTQPRRLQVSDLFLAAEFVREKTNKSLATEVTTKRARRPDQPRRGALRFRSAAVLRGLADRIEPSRTNPVAG